MPQTRTEQNVVKLIGNQFKVNARIHLYIGNGPLGLAATKGCGGAHQRVKKSSQCSSRH